MFKKAGQQGRSERRVEAYSLPYVESLSDARTLLADFFNMLLVSHIDRNGWSLDRAHKGGKTRQIPLCSPVGTGCDTT